MPRPHDDDATKTAEPAEGSREDLNVEPGEDPPDGPRPSNPGTTAEDRDQQAQAPREPRRGGKRTTM